MKAMRPVLTLLGLTLSVTVSSCAAPGSALGRYRIDGEVLQSSTHKPLSHVPVSVTVPAGFGLSASEAGMPEAFGSQDKTEVARTDSRGKFSLNFKTVYHVSFMILPPLGAIPKRPPQPFYKFAIGDKCKRIWGVSFDQNPPEVREYYPLEEELKPLQPGSRAEILAENDEAHCKGNPESCKNDVTSKVTLYWDEKNACKQGYSETLLKSIHHNYRLNGVFVGYGNMFSNSIDVGYSRKLFKSGFLKLELPAGFYGGSYALGVIAKLNLLQIWRFAATFGAGPEWLHARVHDHLSPSYASDLNGIYGFFTGVLSYAAKSGFYSEAGYSSSTIGVNQHDDRLGMRVGWYF